MQIKCTICDGERSLLFSPATFSFSLCGLLPPTRQLCYSGCCFPSSFLFFCPLSCFIHYSPLLLICERQKRSLPCTPHVSCVQHERGSIHVMSQTVRRDSGVTLTPSPLHDLYCLTSCSPSSGFRKTAEGVYEHVYDPCHF